MRNISNRQALMNDDENVKVLKEYTVCMHEEMKTQ
jgi:hypothetical protein